MNCSIAEHAEVRDRERAALEVGELQRCRRGPARRARRARVATSASESRSTERITGTTSPCGAATAMPMFAVGNRSSASSVNWTFTSGWRMSARAQTLASRSVTVTRTSGSSSRERSTSVVRVRHVDRDRELEDRHLPGLGEPAGDRLADARQRHRLDLAGRAGPAAGAAAAGAAARRRGDRRALDVLGDDPPVGPGAGERAEVDAALARHPAGERRGLDPPGRLARAVDRGAEASRRRRRGSAAASAASATALGRFGRLRHGSARVSPGSPISATVLPDRHLALGDGDREQHAARLGLDLLGRLVGVDLEERLALLDLRRPPPSAS